MKRTSVAYLTLFFLCGVPQLVSAITCGFGTDIGGGVCRGYLTSGSSWTVPADWNNANNYIDAIGGGGAGGTDGGGGGAFARKTNVALTSGSAISYRIGGGTGGDTWFYSSSFILAKGASGTIGGSVATSIGDLKYSGGNGSSATSWGMDPNFYFSLGGGGGGAASMYGSPNLCASGADNGSGGNCVSRPTGHEYDATHGSGLGGGGGYAQSDGLCMNSSGSSGGLYGGGGGGAAVDPDCPWYVSSGGGNGAQGLIVIVYTPAPPTCSVSLSPNPINQGQTSTLTWTSADANTWVYIENVGYVSSEGSPSSGSFSVSPSSTTDYSCTAQGSGGTSSSSASLTVYQSCSLPWGGTTAHNTSITAYQASTVPYGSSCTSQSRTCTNGTLSGSYQYQSCTVDQPASCTLDGVTVPDGSSHTFYSQTLPPAGTSCSAYSQSRTCTNGTLSGSSSYQYASCTCNPTYSCTNATTLHSSCPEPGTDTACLAGYSCSGGACVALDAAASPFGTHSGHLQAYPTILRREDTTTLYWNTVNTQPDSCTVRGNGQTWYGPFSGTTGTTTNPLTQTTTFTLSCTGVSGVPFTERATVNTTPMWMEQ